MNPKKNKANPSKVIPIGHYIDGKTITTDEKTNDVFNPATGKITSKVSIASQSSIEKAVSVAQNAFSDWQNTPPQKRAQIMFRYKNLLETRSDDICQAITSEHGKVLTDAQGELARGIEVVEYACGISELLKGEHSRNAGPDIDCWSEFRALGVVVGITPFNFPAMVPMWMFPIAIACGNCFILKPSERDPSTSMLLAELLTEAGLPDGVFNVVNGDKNVVKALIEDSRIQAISFVGSTPVAESIYQNASKAGKRVQALGGAKNHAVIMPDSDLDITSAALMGAAFGSCGQRCMAISVAVCVSNDTADQLVKQLRSRIKNLKTGPGTDITNDMGPLISRQAHNRVSSYIEEGVTQNAELVVDGRNLNVAGHEDGFFIGACLFDKVTEKMSIYQDEIFGPVLCIVRTDTIEEAISLVNRSQFGNGACIFTRDGTTARHFSDQVKAGMVGINVALPVPVANQSFGGWKRSMFGDLYVYGPDAIRFYTRRKTITQKWAITDTNDKPRYSFPSN